MPAVEFVTVTLGAAAAKAILKIWLKDTPGASEIGSGLVDVLKRHTSDLLAQSRGDREFSAIGERVAVSVLPVFEREASINESSKEAVALAVSDALDATRIDADLLASLDIDASALRRAILEV